MTHQDICHAELLIEVAAVGQTRTKNDMVDFETTHKEASNSCRPTNSDTEYISLYQGLNYCLNRIKASVSMRTSHHLVVNQLSEL